MDTCRRHRLPLSAFATALVASLALAVPAAHAANCPGADQLPLLSSPASATSATLCLLNEQRAANGIAPLASEPTLDAAATSYARAMVDQQFFGHVSPAGQELGQRLAPYTTNTRSHNVGENLAWGQGVLGTPAAIVNSWMRSQGHRDNILQADFEQIGVAVVPGSPVGGLINVGATYATEFGSRELGGGSSPIQASAASVSLAVTPPAARPAATKPMQLPAKPMQLSAETKRRISEKCHSVVRRAKASAKTRRARYDRCVRTRTAAARKAGR